MSQKTITIVSVTGHQDYAQGSVYAIMRSYLELQKKLPVENLRCLLVSPEKPKNCPNYIQFLQCEPFGYLEYNAFMIYNLGQLIETDFALIVQNDGFVLNGENWRNEFFDYDYIGAPFPNYYFLENGNIYRYDITDWNENFNKLPSDAIELQNGGFSLRSKRLLELPRKLSLWWEFLPTIPFKEQPLRIEYPILWHNEDMFFSVAHRRLFEQKGMRFAPTKLASLFAVESFNVPIKLGVNISDILGIHTMNDLVMSDVNEVFMKHKVKMVNDNIYSNITCLTLLNNNININVPNCFFTSENGE